MRMPRNSILNCISRRGSQLKRSPSGRGLSSGLPAETQAEGPHPLLSKRDLLFPAGRQSPRVSLGSAASPSERRLQWRESKGRGGGEKAASRFCVWKLPLLSGGHKLSGPRCACSLEDSFRDADEILMAAARRVNKQSCLAGNPHRNPQKGPAPSSPAGRESRSAAAGTPSGFPFMCAEVGGEEGGRAGRSGGGGAAGVAARESARLFGKFDEYRLAID